MARFTFHKLAALAVLGVGLRLAGLVDAVGEDVALGDADFFHRAVVGGGAAGDAASHYDHLGLRGQFGHSCHDFPVN